MPADTRGSTQPSGGLRFLTADVFTDRMFGGNPLAVFPRADGLDAGLMQRIAREMNLSETVFIGPAQSAAHTRRLRIFTPASELPFAGHPTIGAALVLDALGELTAPEHETHIVFEETVGPVPVRLFSPAGGGRLACLTAPRLPEVGPSPAAPDVLAQLLSLDRSQLFEWTGAASAWSAGVPFLFVRLRDSAAVTAARLDMAVWTRELEQWWAPHVVPFALDASRSAIRARMFGPAMGVAEDPATGAAAVALAGYLARLPGDGDALQHWTITQGVELGRPSVLRLEVEMLGGALRAVRLTGEAVLVSEGVMRLPVGSRDGGGDSHAAARS